MRKITDDAAASTRAVRRKKERSSHVTQKSIVNHHGHVTLLDDTSLDEISYPEAKPFENIEE